MADQSDESTSLGDYSRQALKRAIRNEALTHPVTLYPGVLAVLSGVAWGLFGVPALLWGAFGGGLAAAAGLVVNFFFRDQAIAARYVKDLNERLARQKEAALANVLEDLRACSAIAGAKESVAQGMAQFAKIRESYDDLQEMLDKSMGNGAFDQGPIWVAAEQAYLGALDNLREIATTLKSVESIDPDGLGRQIQRLERRKPKSEVDTRELDSLRRRMAVRDEQLAKVDAKLAANEEAITQIEEATAAVAGAAKGESFAEVRQETAVNQLRELARRARERGRGEGL